MSAFLFLSSCPNPTDKTVNVVGNGLGTSNFFSFNLFQFTGKTTTDIYFHCKVELCVRDGNTCAPVCPFPSCIHIHTNKHFIECQLVWIIVEPLKLESLSLNFLAEVQPG